MLGRICEEGQKGGGDSDADAVRMRQMLLRVSVGICTSSTLSEFSSAKTVAMVKVTPMAVLA